MYLHKGLQLPSGTWSKAVLLDQALTETPNSLVCNHTEPLIVLVCISRVYAYKKGQHKRPCTPAFYSILCMCIHTYDVGPTRTGVCQYTLRSYEASIHILKYSTRIGCVQERMSGLDGGGGRRLDRKHNVQHRIQ